MIEEGRPERRIVVAWPELEDKIIKIELKQRRFSPGTAFLMGRQHNGGSGNAKTSEAGAKMRSATAAHADIRDKEKALMGSYIKR